MFLWPDAQESLAFIEDYKGARGEPFDDEERRAAHGAACTSAHMRHAAGTPLGATSAASRELTEFAEALL